MYQEERLVEIVDYIDENRRISVDQICELFNVSRDTARRDLVKLENKKAIVRTRGGAISPGTSPEIKNYRHRLHSVSSEKREIGKRAASLLEPGDTVILDTSTTVQACAGELENTEMTVITNSIHQAEILSGKDHLRIHLLGGQLHKEHGFLYGTSTIEKLNQYHVDKAFIGVVGISEQGLTIGHEEDGMVKRKMMEQAREVIVLADHTKMGVTEFFQFATLEDIDAMITDRTPAQNFRELLEINHVELLVTEEEKDIWS
ncbi:DeoR/GlpR family DNA-binding transcription regulator [Halobacillus sp. B29]|uniref:DeoR/GlpR family DNA-binding transcription regulator n=1 Tax=Halobacillus sp. B29 TaxID=3457432 RepID=UPI003FCC44F3